MSAFPKLKTEAIAQYPSSRHKQYSTNILLFLDGKEERFRDFKQPLLMWTVDLTLLDRDEMAELEEFFIEQDGAVNQFDFTDPWNDTVYTGCSLENSEIWFKHDGPNTGSTKLLIRGGRN
jgi:hypothetical protein